jgi:hypothetical protein
MNNHVTDASEYGNHGTNVGNGVTFSPSNPMEGTHSAGWDAAADASTGPTAGMSTSQGTISLSFGASSCNGGAVGTPEQYPVGHPSSCPAFANRIQVYEANRGRLNVGMGRSHARMTNVFQLVCAEYRHKMYAPLNRHIRRIHPRGMWMIDPLHHPRPTPRHLHTHRLICPFGTFVSRSARTACDLACVITSSLKLTAEIPRWGLLHGGQEQAT